MWRTFYRWFAGVIVLGVFCLPVHAQEDATPKTDNDPPVKEYTVAALTAMLVLVIVCKPSQRRD